MKSASLFVLALLSAVVVFDAVTLGKSGRRVLWLQVLAFVVGGIFITVPNAAQRAADLVGIGRGVDLLLYLIVIWLVREAFHLRHARLVESERLTELARVIATRDAVRRSAPQTHGREL